MMSVGMIIPSVSSLNRRKILRALHIPVGADPSAQSLNLPETLTAQIDLCEAEVLRVSTPRATYRVLPVSKIENLLIGNDIRRLLEGCQEAVLLALTLGADLEKRLLIEEVSNMSNAYILDVCASQAVEEAADDLERQLRLLIGEEGKFLTNRYSPGYGDLPLRVQRPLLDHVNAGRMIGLTLTTTDLMVPRKSITAILGISDRPKADVHGGCKDCPLLTKCSYRHANERCYTG